MYHTNELASSGFWEVRVRGYSCITTLVIRMLLEIP